MGSSDGDGEGVHVGLGDELLGLLRIGQMELCLFLSQPRTVPVLDPAQRPDLSFDADAPGMGGLDDLLRHLDVVFVGTRFLAILAQ